MSYPSKSRPVSYSEVVKTLSALDVQEDINDACGKLAIAMSAMMQKFDSITKQMHTIDLLRVSAPLRPKWDTMRQDFTDLLWHFRTNSGVISGRMKLFCTMVLPMVVRTFDGRSGRSPYQNENIQVLKSYMTISAEHAAHTKSLSDRIMRLGAQLVTFTAEFTKHASRHAACGQKEMCDLSQRLTELESHVQHLFATTSEISNMDVTHLLFTSSRLVSYAGCTTGRSRITRKPIVLDGELVNIGRAYEHTDRKRNEVAHAQYAAQLRQDRADPLSNAQTMLSAFVLDQILTSESGLSIFMSIWTRLRMDCSEVYNWVKNPQTPVPFVISCYLESGNTLYAPLSTALDVYASGVDPSLYIPERRETR